MRLEKTQRIFLTGGTGFLGKILVSLLIKNGYYLRCLSRKERISDNPGIEWVKGDLSSDCFDADLLNGFDTIIHAAGLLNSYNVKKLEGINAQGTASLIKAAESRGIKRFIHISSINVKNCFSPYALSKKRAEDFVLASSLNHIVIRPTVFYGEGDIAGISKIIPLVKRGLVLVAGNGKNKIQPIYIKDLANLIVVILKNQDITERLYEAGGPAILEFNDLIKEISSVLQKRIVIFHIPSFLLKPFFYLRLLPASLNFLDFGQDKIADSALIKKDFNFNPRSFKDGLKDYLCQN